MQNCLNKVLPDIQNALNQNPQTTTAALPKVSSSPSTFFSKGQPANKRDEELKALFPSGSPEDDLNSHRRGRSRTQR